MGNTKCKVCGRDAETYPCAEDKQYFKCSYCGNYSVVGSFFIEDYSDKTNFYKVSSWIREQNDEYRTHPIFDWEEFGRVISKRDKKIKEKFNLLLQYLAKANEPFSYYRNETVTGKNDRRISTGKLKNYVDLILVKNWIKSFDELAILFQNAIDKKFIDGQNRNNEALDFKKLTFDGLQYLEEIEEPNANSRKIFVAFHFNESLIAVFNTHLKNAIEENGFEYIVVNQDNVEHNKNINDEIIVKLKTSKMVIADFSNHRNNVYFEAGFAMGMNIPIIWTCQKGHEGNLSFDVRQFPHIVWKNKDDLVKQVIDRMQRMI